MTAPSGGHGRGPGLINRETERAVLDRFVAGVRAGEGQALVARGEPGVGKTLLLDYLAGRSVGCRTVRVAGVQSEMELAFAGLHQLCWPLLEHAERLPAAFTLAAACQAGCGEFWVSGHGSCPGGPCLLRFSRCSPIAVAAAGLLLPEGFSRCRPQPGYRSGHGQG
jgi:hypothetical protein